MTPAKDLITLLSSKEYTVDELAELIGKNVQIGEVYSVNESFFFGIMLYAYTEDLKNAEVTFPFTVNPHNPLFSYFSPEHIASYLHTLLCKINGYIEISKGSQTDTGLSAAIVQMIIPYTEYQRNQEKQIV